jgi:putative ABC transport system permease protein
VFKRRDYGSFLMIRVEPGDMPGQLAAIRGLFQRGYPGLPFSYGFVDQDLDKLYQSETRMGMLFRVFALLAIVISCMGLFGLATFATRRRTREIGVRKVLGATESRIVALLAREFLMLVMISLLVAFPIAWYTMHFWLQEFVYQIRISVWVFAAAGVAALLVAFATLAYQTIRAAKANPVKALRAEY